MRVVGNLNLGGDLVLRLLRGVDNVRFIFDKRPFEALLRTVDIEALTILSSGVKEETPNVGCDVAVLNLDVA